jgi:beta-glucosidase
MKALMKQPKTMMLLNAGWIFRYYPKHANYAVLKLTTFQLGFWADPIYLTGDYPASVLKNNNDTVLQRFTADQIAQNKGAADFFGLNHYTTRLVTDGNDNGGKTNFLHQVLIAFRK